LGLRREERKKLSRRGYRDAPKEGRRGTTHKEDYKASSHNRIEL